MTVRERAENVTILQHVARDGTLWGSRGPHVVRRRPGGTWERVVRMPLALPRDLFGFTRLTQRAARADKCNVFVNRHGRALVIRAGRVYALRGDALFPLVHLQGDCALHRGICEDRRGAAYFGEYAMNPSRGPVRVFRVDPEVSRAEVAWELPPRSVRHVHGVYRDPFREDTLWATLGDHAGECSLVETHDGFRTVIRYGDGSQRWRAVALFFTETHVCWLTDSHIEQNHACRMARGSGRLEVGHPIDCPGWYGAPTTDGLTVAFTTVERGPGVARDHAAVLVSRDAFHWTEVYAFKKDPYRPLELFKYGDISCPSGDMSSGDFWLSGEGLVGLDGVSLRVAFQEEA